LCARPPTAKTAVDKVVQFIPPGSDAAIEVNKVFLKETEKRNIGPE
jgi:hypothetical protein